MSTSVLTAELTLAEIDEAITSARATLRARMPIEQREAVEDYLDNLLGQRSVTKTLNELHAGNR